MSSGGVRWSIIIAWDLLLACEPSPGSFTIKGYTLGIGPKAIPGKQLGPRPTLLPGNHSTLPCLPTCIYAFTL